MTATDPQRRIEDALLHYRIGQETARLTRWPALVDWCSVAEQMAAALRGEAIAPPPRGTGTLTVSAVRQATPPVLDD